MVAWSVMGEAVLVAVGWLCGVLVTGVHAFNIETDYFVTHRGPAGSKFGFSLAQHKDSKGTWLLVGAPEAESGIHGVIQGGAVYRCHSQLPDHCDIILFDSKGNHFDGSQFIDEKSHQWFGASVVSRDGVVAACAPRYVWYSVKKNRREPIGSCYVMTNDRGPRRFKSYYPCMTSSWGYHRQGTCQAGFGVALSQGGEKLYVGAVGSWYWQGQVFYQNLLNMQQTLSTPEGPKQDDMSYMGFSLAPGRFDGDELEDVAVGVPKGHDLKGKVILFSHSLEVLYNLTGDQIGSYFGYSVAVLDWDGDGLDDVAVGAPWYSQPAVSSIFEEGEVALFKHTQQHNFRRIQRLFGKRSRSHFGLSMTSLKDLNGDGFEDLAVGAPGDGSSSLGGVYIFLGSTSGLVPEPTQVLLAEELSTQPMRTFGWSLSGGLDLDGNEYPDLAVGGHESDAAIIFRTRPVATVNASIRIQSESGVFELESSPCSLQDNTDVPCYPLHYCLSYSGKSVPPSLEMLYSVRLDASSAEPSPRIFFLKKEGVAVFNSSMTLHKDVRECKSLYIYASPSLQDKLSPIIFELSYTIGGSWNPSQLKPILAPTPFGREPLTRDVIYFHNNCGHDNICIPNLEGHLFMEDADYVLGSSKNPVLNVRISNRGEDAYGANAYVEIPQGLHFSKFLITYNGAPEDVTPFCTAAMADKSTKSEEEEEGMEEEGEEKIDTDNLREVVVCEVGNPLPSGVTVAVQLPLQPSASVARFAQLRVRLRVNSTNPDRNWTLGDNSATLSIPVVRESVVDIRGISWPDGEFSYNASLFGKLLLGPETKIKYEREAGPEVTHIYDVVNQGPSDLKNIDVYLLWPTQTVVGDPLLYLARTPYATPKSVQCDPVSGINYLTLEVESESPDSLSRMGMGTPAVSKSRHPRRVSEDAPSPQLLTEHGQDRSGLQHLLSCGSANCTITIMKCVLPLFKAQDNFIVRAPSRLWVDTVEKLGVSNLRITSMLVVHSEEYSTRRNSSERGMTWNATITSVVKTRTEVPVPSLSWLIWLGSAVVGLLVLAVLILLLWMIGFFKRQRPQDEAENELINRNGTNGKL